MLLRTDLLCRHGNHLVIDRFAFLISRNLENAHSLPEILDTVDRNRWSQCRRDKDLSWTTISQRSSTISKGQFRKFVPDFSSTARSFTMLIWKSLSLGFDWTYEQANTLLKLLRINQCFIEFKKCHKEIVTRVPVVLQRIDWFVTFNLLLTVVFRANGFLFI